MDPGSTLRLISDILIVVQQNVFKLLASEIQLELISSTDANQQIQLATQKDQVDLIQNSLPFYNSQITTPFLNEADIEVTLTGIENSLNLFDSTTVDSRPDVSNCFASYSCTSSQKGVFLLGEHLNTLDDFSIESRYIFNNEKDFKSEDNLSFRRSDDRISRAEIGSFLFNASGAKILEFSFELYFEVAKSTLGVRGLPVDFGLSVSEHNEDGTSVTIIKNLGQCVAAGGPGGELGISLIGVAVHDIKPEIKTVSARLTTFITHWDAREFQLSYSTPYAPFFRCKMSY